MNMLLQQHVQEQQQQHVEHLVQEQEQHREALALHLLQQVVMNMLLQQHVQHPEHLVQEIEQVHEEGQQADQAITIQAEIPNDKLVTLKELFTLCTSALFPLIIIVLSLRYPHEKERSTQIKAGLSVVCAFLFPIFYFLKTWKDCCVDHATILYYIARTTGGERIFYEKFPSMVVGTFLVIGYMGACNFNALHLDPVIIYWTSFSICIMNALYAALQLYKNDKDAGFITEVDGVEVCLVLRRSTTRPPRGRRIIYERDPRYQPFSPDE